MNAHAIPFLGLEPPFTDLQKAAAVILPFPYEGDQPVTYIPMFGGREQIDVVNAGGSHGGGDPLLRDEIFLGADPTATIQRQAGLDDGIDVVLTGIALYRSGLEKRPIAMQELREKVYGRAGC